MAERYVIMNTEEQFFCSFRWNGTTIEEGYRPIFGVSSIAIIETYEEAKVGLSMLPDCKLYKLVLEEYHG